MAHWDIGETAALEVPVMGEDDALDLDDEDQGEDEAAQETARQTLAMLRTGRPLTEDEIMGYSKQGMICRVQSRKYLFVEMR